MTWRRFTECYIIANVAITVAYAFIVRIFGGNEATVSAVMQDTGNRYPITVGIVFAVVAHWYWSVR